MQFSRLDTRAWLDKLRLGVWPRGGLGRAWHQRVLQLTRLEASPVAVALGLAVGVFMAFQPIIGFQMLLAGAVALAFRASVGAAMLGTFIGTPATWPFMWVASYWLGATVIGERHPVTTGELWNAFIGLGAMASPGGVTAASESAGTIVRQVLYPLAVGAVPLGLLAGAAIYVMVLRAYSLARR